MSKLFPEIGDPVYATRNQRRAYVEDRLVEMASAETLFLTECLSDESHPEIPQLVAEVILGHMIDSSGDQQTGIAVPLALASYMVRISAIPHIKVYDAEVRGQPPIEKLERQPIAYKMPGNPSRNEPIRNQHGGAKGVTRHKPNVVHTGKLELDMPLPHAVYCLRQCGKNVKTARSRRLQEQYWHCEEIRPGDVKPLGEDKPEKRGPGRPKKSSSAYAG